MISPIKGQFVRSSATGRNTRAVHRCWGMRCAGRQNAAQLSVSKTKPNTNIAPRYRHWIHRTSGPNLCRKSYNTHNAPRETGSQAPAHMQQNKWACLTEIDSINWCSKLQCNVLVFNQLLFKQGLDLLPVSHTCEPDSVRIFFSNVRPGIKAFCCGLEWIR